MKKIISIGLSILFVLCMSSIAYAENDTAPVKRLQSEEDAANSKPSTEPATGTADAGLSGI